MLCLLTTRLGEDGPGLQAGKVIRGNFCYLCRQTTEFMRCNLKKAHGWRFYMRTTPPLMGHSNELKSR